MANIAVVGTFDTKGTVHRYLADLIKGRGDRPILIDCSLRGIPQIRADIERDEIFLRAGRQFSELREERKLAASLMSECLGQTLMQLYGASGLNGLVTAVGGLGGRIVSGALARLPFGFPSVFVSHLSPGDLGVEGVFKDVVLVRSLLELDRVNKVVRPALNQAVGAVCGMVEFKFALGARTGKGLVVASHFGAPDSGLHRSYSYLEETGLEVYQFAEKGIGGRLMDAVVGGGFASGVVDASLSDIADFVVGGVLPASPDRMGATARTGCGARMFCRAPVY